MAVTQQTKTPQGSDEAQQQDPMIVAQQRHALVRAKRKEIVERLRESGEVPKQFDRTELYRTNSSYGVQAEPLRPDLGQILKGAVTAPGLKK